MTALEEVRRRLSDLTTLVARYDELDVPQGSAEWHARQSLLELQVRLHQQARLLEGSADIVIKLAGGSERHSLVEADFLGGFLTELQGTLAAIAQVLMHGYSTGRGALPADVVGATLLRVGATEPGSFHVLLDGPRGRVVRTTIEGGEERPVFDEVVDRFMDVLRAASRADEVEIQGAITELRSERAVRHVHLIAKELAATQTNVTVVQRDLFTDQPREEHVSAEVAAVLSDALNRTEQWTTTVYAVGQLSGVRWTKGVFDLEIPHGEEVEIMTGSVTADLRNTVRPVFDRMVRAELERTTTRVRGVERTSYLLVGVTSTADA